MRLTEDAIEKIAIAVESGAFLSPAVESAGFSMRAYQRWDRVGKKALKKKHSELTEPEKMYKQFVLRIRKAKGTLQVECESRLRELAENDADVLFRFMAKRFKSVWGEQKQPGIGVDANHRVMGILVGGNGNDPKPSQSI